MGCDGCGRPPCSCAVLEGDGVTITGTGIPSDPWVIDVDGVILPLLPSGGDDTIAVAVAVATSRPMLGTFLISDNIAVGSGGIIGYGGNINTPRTVFTCTTAAAGFTVTGGGGPCIGFQVDGNNVATLPFWRRGGAGASGRFFSDMGVKNSAQDGIQCDSAQNEYWEQCYSAHNGRDCLVLDHGYGGSTFDRCELDTAGRYNLSVRHDWTAGDPYLIPADNYFAHCLFERNSGAASSVVDIDGGYRLTFDSCSFYANTATSGPTFNVRSQATRIIVKGNSYFQSTPNPVPVAGTKAISVDANCQTQLEGTIQYQNYDVDIYLAAANAEIDDLAHHETFNQNFFKSAAGGVVLDSWFNRTRFTPSVFKADGAASLDRVVEISGETGFRWFRDATGRQVWGSGADFVGDVTLKRLVAGVLGLGLVGTAFVPGQGTTVQRPAAAVGITGALYWNTTLGILQRCNGAKWIPEDAYTEVLGGVGFQNSWGNAGTAGFTTAGFRLISDNTVRLKGLIVGGAINTVAFTLPAAYRPAHSQVLEVGAQAVTVGADGTVKMGSAATADLCSATFDRAA